MSARRSLAIGTVIALAPLLLAGCYEFPAVGPAAIQREGISLKIAVCSAIDADLVLVEERNISANRGWSTVWRFEADLPLASGDVISTDPSVTAEFPGEVRRQPTLESGDEIGILFARNQADPPEHIDAKFRIGSEGLSETSWLHPDGTTTTDPCAG